MHIQACSQARVCVCIHKNMLYIGTYICIQRASERTCVHLVVSKTMPAARMLLFQQSHAHCQHASVPTVVLWLLPDSPPRKARLSVLLQDGGHEAEVDGAV